MLRQSSLFLGGEAGFRHRNNRLLFGGLGASVGTIATILLQDVSVCMVPIHLHVSLWL